jgi:16S rRNA (guanine(966)-N(2))-methyltransferase RsmD
MSLRIIAGKFKGRPLKAPKGKATRPTQGMLREAVFNICQNEIHGARFLDLFAGSGAMGLEALSRGAVLASFVEQNKFALRSIRENGEELGVLSEMQILPLSFEKAMLFFKKQGAQFDLIYIDPPYDLAADLSAIPSILAPHGTVFLEERFNPKGNPKAKMAALYAKDQRRFGEALLTIF